MSTRDLEPPEPKDAPVRGGDTAGMPPAGRCPNCAAERSGRYCARCGQKSTDIAVSLRTLLAEFRDEYLNVDSRLFRSLVYLMFRPGFLTREYLNGRRARYIRPFRLYIVSSLIFFFALFSFFARPELEFGGAEGRAIGELLQERIGEATEQDAAAAAREPRAAAPAPAEQPAEEAPAPAPAPGVADAAEPPAPMPSELREAIDAVTVQVAGRQLPVRERLELLGTMSPQQLTDALYAGLQRHLPRMMFLLLPFFALLLKLLYARRDWFYAEHFIFALHIHAFAFAILLLLLVLPAGAPTALLLGWAAVYLFVALRRVYGQAWLRTAAKYLLLVGIYAPVLAAGMVGSLLVTLLLL